MTPSDKNYKWIYTYDYAPDSVWEPWRDSDTAHDWIADEIEAVMSRVKNESLLSFILLTDSHFTFNGTWQDTAFCIKAIADRFPLIGIIHLGDLTDGLLPLEKTKEIEKQCIADMRACSIPVYLVPGNHDYNYFRKNPDICYPEVPQYYVDYHKEKLRLIFIDSFDPKDALRYGFSGYCVHWLDSVLNLMHKGYKAVIFSHVPPLVRLQAWTKDIRNRDKLMEVLNKYSDRIMVFINGHNHCDHIFNDLYNGNFPIVSINCAKCEYFTDHKPEGAVVPYRELGSRLQESFDIMQIDVSKNEIYFTRFGAGTDRYIINNKGYFAD